MRRQKSRTMGHPQLHEPPMALRMMANRPMQTTRKLARQETCLYCGNNKTANCYQSSDMNNSYWTPITLLLAR
jgi:hypothetical protein